ncbi:MAG TPA: M28 family metallopeptidase [Polyangia bacterium]|nr:M28 family metallopeptidase [Polyangia bacterium]
MFAFRHGAAALALALTACSDQGPPKPSPTDPAALMKTLRDLAALGQKHVGTPPGQQAGDYAFMRMQAAGLSDVHFEEFQFPRHDVASSALAVSIDGVAVAPAPGHDVFDGSGAGHADADCVYVMTATDSELAGKNLQGKVALVDRSVSFHRSAQYLNVYTHGAVAMLYVSAAPGNLRQVGSVRVQSGWTPLGPVPTVTIGADDGQMLKEALAAGKIVHVVMDVQASATRASGRNVIGRVPGKDARGQIVIGAHYDTWFEGSVDNGGGVAALVALAERRKKEPQPRYTLVFVAYDGEEVALYGGYDFLRRHRVETAEPILSVFNFESPSAINPILAALTRSNVGVLDQSLRAVGLTQLYRVYAGMEVIPQLFGGVIPTDIQGIYRAGVPTVTTAVQADYYHTTEDKPDTVDTSILAQAVDEFDGALDRLMASDPDPFAIPDPALWRASVSVQPRAAGQPLMVDATVTDAVGAPQADAPALAALLVDDFFEVATASARTDGSGRVTFQLPAAAAEMGAGRRFVHVTAGPTFPLVEQIVPVP